MPKIAFAVESTTTWYPMQSLSQSPASAETTAVALPDTITLWPSGGWSSSSEGAYPMPGEPESSSVVIVTTSAYIEPSQEPPPPEPEPTATTTTTSIETTVVEYPPPSLTCSCSSSSVSDGSSTESTELPVETTTAPPEPAQPIETGSATRGAAPNAGLAMFILGIVYVFVDMR